MANYRLGWNYSKIIQYDINKVLTKGPGLPVFTFDINTIKTGETKTYVLSTSSPYLIESVVGTNITCIYDPSIQTLTISNPTGPVSLSFVTYYTEDNLCWLFVAGAGGGETSQQYAGSWPNKGTVTYIDKYNEQKTINIADLGLYLSWNHKFAVWNTLDVKLGCNVICTNVGLGYVNKSNAELRFANSSASYDYSVLIYYDNVESYTFTNVVKVPEKQHADIVIRSTR